MSLGTSRWNFAMAAHKHYSPKGSSNFKQLVLFYHKKMKLQGRSKAFQPALDKVGIRLAALEPGIIHDAL